LPDCFTLGGACERIGERLNFPKLRPDCEGAELQAWCDRNIK